MYVIGLHSAVAPLLLILTLLGATFFHVAVLLTQSLTSLFASVIFKLTVYVHGSVNVFVHVLSVHAVTLLYVSNALHPQLFHSYIVYVRLHHHISLPLNVYVIVCDSFFGPSFFIYPTGFTLFHVAVAVAQFDHNHCASFALYEYVIVVASSWAGALYVLFVALEIDVVHVLSLYHWYPVFVVHPGSVTFAVNVIWLHSFPLFVTLFAVGATFCHVTVTFLQLVLSALFASFTFT